MKYTIIQNLFEFLTEEEKYLIKTYPLFEAEIVETYSSIRQALSTMPDKGGTAHNTHK